MNRIGTFLNTLMEGGDWTTSLSTETRRNLRWFWSDGLFAAASDAIPLTYFTLYLLAIGMTATQVGLLNSLTNLSSALVLLPGALMVERFGHRKELAVLFGGTIARFLLIVLALLPLGLVGKGLIAMVMVVSIIRSIGGNLTFPAWMSLSADVVPMAGRGRYFASRNLAMSAASMLITYLAGEWITQSSSLQGYQLALTASFVFGMASTFSFNRICDPRPGHRATETFSLRSAIADLRTSPAFLALCAVAAIWNFFINLSGPFFSIYMAEELHFTAAMIGMTAILPSVTRILTQRKAGELTDRFGPRIIQAVLMFLIPSLPFAWIFTRSYAGVLLIQAAGGVLWGTFELVSFNVLLGILPQNLQARYSAIYQIIVALAFSAGAVAGSTVLALWSYRGIFITTTVGRLVAAVAFVIVLRLIKFDTSK
ncbi:MAG: MFS transporter [Anaerolineales bacterium]